ncbi:MAG: ATP-binding protein [Motilibacteraceae bacterium]
MRGLEGVTVAATRTVLVPFAAASVATARRTLADDLFAHHLPRVTVEDAVLVLSELLSNALKHARPLPSGRVEVRWSTTGSSTSPRVELAVVDGGGPTRPRPAAASLSATGGRGLGIVGDLADDWGVLDEEGTTTVWAVVSGERRTVGAAGAPGPRSYR